ncbi:MAG: hypothetical protein QOE82_1584 [Thermoanaerobaculia bacterium]|jgi:hypothetical protein|nr:hypothetical protein [Thermoanaerobaculia bacterium]
MRDLRRITIIARGAEAPARGWNASQRSTNRIIFAETFAIMRGALDHASEDVDRLIIDCTSNQGEFLTLLTALPPAFGGDVLFISTDETAYLSTTGRAGGRLLYALAPEDVQFYLDAQRLVTKQAMAA